MRGHLHQCLAREFRRKRDLLGAALREAGIVPMESQVGVGGWGGVFVGA